MRNRTLITLSLLLSLVCLAACSDDDDAATDGGVTPDAAPCGPTTYPCGPYGTNTGDKVKNMELEGYMDAKELCRLHKDKELDLTKLAKISFLDYYKGGAACPNDPKKLLWVMVSAGWCLPCKAEVQSVQAKYKGDKYDKRLGIINVVIETTKNNEPADAAFIKQWASGYKLTYPVLMDPIFKTGAYFSKKAAPFNMLIDTKEMTILYRSTGADLANIEKKITEFFK